MKELMAMVAGMFAKRYSKRQKTAFITYISNRAHELGQKIVIDNGYLDRRSCRNIYLGDLKHADIIVAVPYDTPSKLLWRGIHYYPVNPRRNERGETVAKLLDFTLLIFLAVAYYVLVLQRFMGAGNLAKGLSYAGMLVLLFGMFRQIDGVANRNNCVRNSSSVVVALEYFWRCSRKNTAVALLDQSCCGFIGYRQLAQYLKASGKSKTLLAFDCIASGDEFHLHCSSKQLDFFAKAIHADSIELHTIDEEHQEEGVFALFPKAAVLTGGCRDNGDTIICGTRCRSDDRVNLEKMERAIELLRDIATATDGRLGGKCDEN